MKLSKVGRARLQSQFQVLKMSFDRGFSYEINFTWNNQGAFSYTLTQYLKENIKNEHTLHPAPTPLWAAMLRTSVCYIVDFCTYLASLSTSFNFKGAHSGLKGDGFRGGGEMRDKSENGIDNISETSAHKKFFQFNPSFSFFRRGQNWSLRTNC